MSQLEGSLQKALDRAAASDALASDLQNSSSRFQAESIEQKEALKSLEAKQESLRKILVDAKTKHEVAVSHLESVKARNLFMSAESLKLSTKNRKLDLDLSFEKEKNEALEGNNRKLQKTCKELRGDLAKAECEVQKSGTSSRKSLIFVFQSSHARTLPPRSVDRVSREEDPPNVRVSLLVRGPGEIPPLRHLGEGGGEDGGEGRHVCSER